ncbi:fumarate lyase [Natronospirillum operosum]|uniref:Fumarate lyase n=1 Tax=Natronospirillum operosum TaxID=2759953 RepID=A0A4Z0WAJ9_9GAMM|nr:lyase family protein [Natronospirillum operosum]TGG93385.1 fumarate lyase [Natronospirillum operosum]
MAPAGLYDGLFRDPTVSRILDDTQRIQRLLMVERALTEALARAGLCTEADAQAVSAALARFQPDMDAISAGMAQDGVPLPTLIKALKAEIPAVHHRALHHGATSQDIMDTASVLESRELLDHFERQIRQLVQGLAALTAQHRNQLVAGRTRSQQGAPMNLGLKIVRWLAPLVRQLERLQSLRPRLLKVQLAGAVGNLSALQNQAIPVRQALAEQLQLAADGGWHTQRDSLQELATWLAITTTALGKMAHDWMLMAQTEVGEIRFANGGGSSTLPQKSNPVNAELIQTLARRSAHQAAEMLQAGLGAHERDGVSWSSEWLALPELYHCTGAALHQSLMGLQHMEFNPVRLQQNLWQSRGLLFAETLRFRLHSGQPAGIDAALLLRQSIDAVNQNPDSPETLIERINTAAGTAFTAAELEADLLHAGCTDPDIDRILQAAQIWMPADD